VTTTAFCLLGDAAALMLAGLNSVPPAEMAVAALMNSRRLQAIAGDVLSWNGFDLRTGKSFLATSAFFY
jgi:hypothetical protein